ncbi:Major surface antigen 4 precursor [Anaplasma phagocytophilum]|uniref:Major surface antigen 4 n=1 Tax=Anaplasma phagocytophilum TaxID=948 RepID=A0AA45ZI61_ANAPH|nr:Major surface antigen 4 precursor [Anaplasma phagocytophilum]SBO33717.1 Major surface antigen 4 precursor [Anaplasma phagocytophilum]SBO33780.1 Major surface antigen 4 precursor [Anaplasma phagocytophilum]
MEISAPKIDGKVCSKTHARESDSYGTQTTYGTSVENTKTTEQCSGLTTENSQKLSDFVRGVGLKDDKNWPTGQYSKTSSNGVGGGKPNSNASAVATDLTKLTPEEKTIVAGLLAKTIEGGEVVEIRAVSSTSVMVNACYDLLSEGLGVVPYACVGLGGNFVGVVDEYSTIRWSLILYDPCKSLGKIGAASLRNRLRSAILHT